MPRPSKETIYVDTCAVLWYFNKPEATGDISLDEAKDRKARMARLFYLAETNQLEVITSMYTKIEAAFINEETAIKKLIDDVPQRMDAVFDDRNIMTLINVSHSITQKAREVVRSTKFPSGVIKPKDAIHVASAIVYNATKLYTYDNGVLNWSGKREVNGLNICHPDIELPPIRF